MKRYYIATLLCITQLYAAHPIRPLATLCPTMKRLLTTSSIVSAVRHEQFPLTKPYLFISEGCAERRCDAVHFDYTHFNQGQGFLLTLLASLGKDRVGGSENLAYNLGSRLDDTILKKLLHKEDNEWGYAYQPGYLMHSALQKAADSAEASFLGVRSKKERYALCMQNPLRGIILTAFRSRGHHPSEDKVSLFTYKVASDQKRLLNVSYNKYTQSDEMGALDISEFHDYPTSWFVQLFGLENDKELTSSLTSALKGIPAEDVQAFIEAFTESQLPKDQKTLLLALNLAHLKETLQQGEQQITFKPAFS